MKNKMEEISVKHMARKISFQESEGDKEKMIMEYMKEVKRNLLASLEQIEKSDSSMAASETSRDDMEDAQKVEASKVISEDSLEELEDFVQKMKDADDAIRNEAAQKNRDYIQSLKKG